MITGSNEGLLCVYDSSVPHSGTEFDPVLENLEDDDRESMEVISASSSLTQELFLEGFTELKDVSSLSHLSKLSIRDSLELEDITPLCNIPDLSFFNCPALSDFSMFAGKQLSKLIVDSCPLLIDVCSLRNIRTLRLIGCENLIDVSPLKGVYNLSLWNCTKVKDISGLGGHHRLEVSYCAPKMIGYESLLNIPHVRLARCDISDLNVLRFAHSIEFLGCKMITDVHPIQNVKRVMLDRILNITNISELCHVYDLTILMIPLTNDELSSLQNHKLELHLKTDHHNFLESIPSFLPSTKHFMIIEPPLFLAKSIENGNLPFLKNLQTLTIEGSDNIRFIKGLEDIPTVILTFMRNLSDINGLGRNRRVELRHCYKITNVNSLANVSIVTIEQCPEIVDYSELSKVPRLKISN